MFSPVETSVQIMLKHAATRFGQGGKLLWQKGLGQIQLWFIALLIGVLAGCGDITLAVQMDMKNRAYLKN